MVRKWVKTSLPHFFVFKIIINLSSYKGVIQWAWQHGITKCAAIYLLRNDIKRIYVELKKKLPFFQSLDSERQYALIDMSFNIGISGLLRFKEMLKAIKKHNFKLAAEECLNSKYAKDVGQRAERIARVLATGEFKL